MDGVCLVKLLTEFVKNLTSWSVHMHNKSLNEEMNNWNLPVLSASQNLDINDMPV